MGSKWFLSIDSQEAPVGPRGIYKAWGQSSPHMCKAGWCCTRVTPQGPHTAGEVPKGMIPKQGKRQVTSLFQQDILLVQQLQNIQISERHTLFLSWHSFVSGNYSRRIYRTVNIAHTQKKKNPK